MKWVEVFIYGRMVIWNQSRKLITLIFDIQTLYIVCWRLQSKALLCLKLEISSILVVYWIHFTKSVLFAQSEQQVDLHKFQQIPRPTVPSLQPLLFQLISIITAHSYPIFLKSFSISVMVPYCSHESDLNCSSPRLWLVYWHSHREVILFALRPH